MTKTLVAAVTAIAFATMSFGAMAATTTTVTKTVVVHHPAHWHMHQVCKVVWHHHKKVKVCTWVKNK